MNGTLVLMDSAVYAAFPHSGGSSQARANMHGGDSEKRSIQGVPVYLYK
jgi:hypothetical protein